MEELDRAVEAALFAAEEPMTAEALAGFLGGAAVGDVRDALRSVADHYEKRGVHLVERGKRWHFETAPDLAHLLRREKEQVRRLSRAATEVLAIIAYHEPVSRAEIESIRGVQTSSGTLDVLMEAGWVKIAGRRYTPPQRNSSNISACRAVGIYRELPNCGLRVCSILSKMPMMNSLARATPTNKAITQTGIATLPVRTDWYKRPTTPIIETA